MSDTTICFMPATELAKRIDAGELGAVEVLEAYLHQIARVNPQVNAIVTLTAERALAQAQAADAAYVRRERRGPLHGLPVVHKDLVETAGVRTTYGSPIYRDHVPDMDALIVARLRAAGAISLGKSNTPEFGAGSQTFNQVFGATRNPYDLDKTCGGSSGGAAVALACGMTALADGSDLGGSLRNPAGYCNVVGFRTTPGRVPVWPNQSPLLPFSVEGPMARTVADVALMLSAIAGPDLRVPLALSEPGATFARIPERSLGGVRVAWSRDLGGLPFDGRTATVFEAQRATFVELGCVVEDADPDLHDADEIFQTFRALGFELGLGELLDTRRAELKDTVIWNIEAGRRLSGPAVGRAMRLHAALLERMHTFFQSYDYMVLPVSQVPPFAIEQPYVNEINGLALSNYLEWMRSCYYITVTMQPSIALPAGFTPDGLPVGLQIVGRPRDELGVLQIAQAYEAATQIWRTRPALAE